MQNTIHIVKTFHLLSFQTMVVQAVIGKEGKKGSII